MTDDEIRAAARVEKERLDRFLRTGHVDPEPPRHDAKLQAAIDNCPEMLGVEPFPTIDVDRYARDGIPSIEWLREPWIAREDVGIAYGAPYIGKSTAALSLATCLAAGMPWLDSPAADPVPVLYINGESGERSVVRLAMRFGAPIDGLHLVSASGSLSLLDSECVRRLHRTVSDLRPALLILDSVSTTFGIANENETAEVRDTMEELFSIRDKFKCATLAIHHTPKNPMDGRNGRSALEKIRGSSVFGAMASLAWHLEAAPGGEALDVKITKARDRDLRHFSRRIQQAHDGSRLYLCAVEGPCPLERSIDKWSRLLMEHMLEGTDYRRRELIAAVGGDERSVSKALTHLEAVRRVVSPKRGFWRLAPSSAGGNAKLAERRGE